MTIQLATPQLLELAEAMRGPEWADDLAGALAAARNAGWDWPKAFLAAARLMADEEAHPRDLTATVRDPLHRNASNDPSVYDRGGALARDLLAARETGQDEASPEGDAAA
jgi:hypothetical protein